MRAKFFLPILATSALAMFPAVAEDNTEQTAPFTAAEREAVYTASIEKRVADILKDVALSDTNKIARIHDAIIAQYRSLRARDEAIDAMFQSLSKNAPGIETNREAILQVLSQQLHNHFLKRLAADLSPGQVEKVKDKMTYNKLKVTHDAYCEIVPSLTDVEKSKILELLKAAREDAMDGGSADEKTAIFQKYKDQINAMLNANGHDVAKATKEWEAKHPSTAQSSRDGEKQAKPASN
ncbi:MAG: DUF3826 domain-containing protein [Verrucomicrobia bacterium]|nr:DUF3826 domain-containing protein [Verrucomicrobiota bacterium]